MSRRQRRPQDGKPSKHGERVTLEFRCRDHPTGLLFRIWSYDATPDDLETGRLDPGHRDASGELWAIDRCARCGRPVAWSEDDIRQRLAVNRANGLRVADVRF